MIRNRWNEALPLSIDSRRLRSVPAPGTRDRGEAQLTPQIENELCHVLGASASAHESAFDAQQKLPLKTIKMAAAAKAAGK